MNRIKICLLAALIALCAGLFVAPQAKAVNAPVSVGDGIVLGNPSDNPQVDPGADPGNLPDPAFEPYWIVEGGKIYYVIDELGTRATGWYEFDGVVCWFDSNGVLAVKTWVEIDGNWYYFDQNAALAYNTCLEIDGNWYYFDQNAIVAIKTWVQIDGNWYYFDPSTLALQ